MKLLSATQLVGNTPAIYIGQYGSANLYAKLEGQNPTGSLKDRTAFAIIESISKTIKKRTLLDASSGSFACSLSYFGRITKIPVTVVVNSKISNDNLAFLKTQGTNIIKYGNVTGESREYCKNLIKKNPDKWLFTDQLTNPIAPKIHDETTAKEILKDFPDVKLIVGSKGSGATLCGIVRHVARLKSNILIVGSIGIPGDIKKIAGTFVNGADFVSPFIKELSESKYYTGDISVTYTNAMKHSIKLPVLVGPQGGGVYEATLKAIKKFNVSGDVVMVMGDSLLKNVSRFN
jgi:cysteine synthase